MTPDDPTSVPGSDPIEIDFAAIVAEHNAANEAKDTAGPDGPVRRRSGRDRGRTTSEALGSSSERDEDDPTVPRPAASGSRWWRIGYPSAIVGSLVVLVVLIWVGLGTILDSTDGQLTHRVDDPAALGYEAALEKTPTALMLIIGSDGALQSMALVSLMSDSSAGVMAMPAQVVLDTSYGAETAARWYAIGGAASVSAGVGEMLQLGFNDTIEIAASQWSTIMAPYGPLTVVSPDPVRDASDKQVFPKGSVTLAPDQIATYLGSLGPKDSDLLRVSRQESFWKAFLAMVKAKPTAFALPTDAGFGFFVTGAARGDVDIIDLPVATTATPAGQPQRYAVQEEAAQDSLAAIVPFPDGGGLRARFRVLDGTGVLDNGIGAALILAAAGGQIDVIGNANRFDVETTTLYYYDGTPEEVAAHFRDALGLGQLQSNDASNAAADIVVVLGADYADRGGSVGGSTSSTATTVVR